MDLTSQEANRLETHYIDTLRTLAPGGYNLKRGGDSNEWSEDSKKSLSNTMIIKWEDYEFRESQTQSLRAVWEDPNKKEAHIARAKKTFRKFTDSDFLEANVRLGGKIPLLAEEFDVTISTVKEHRKRLGLSRPYVKKNH